MGGKAYSNILKLPQLRPDQWEIASHQAKLKVIAMGRRWGKTTMAGGVALAAARAGAKVAWICPTYKNARPLWRFAEGAVSTLDKKYVKTNKTDRTIDFVYNGGFLAIYSADNDVGIRGEWFDVVIIEEAAQIKQSSFYDVILPTLADRDGICFLITTPLGRNWVWREAMKAKADTTGRSRFWTAPSSANPNPKIKKAYELAKTRVPLNTFRQEWDAEFLEGEGSVFSRIDQLGVIKSPVPVYKGEFVAGLDLAQKRDYTALIVMDANTRHQVDMLRIHKLPWKVIRQQIKDMCTKWKVEVVIGEANSIGGPNIEALQDEGVPVYPFETTASSKSPLIESLVLAFEQEELRIFDDPVMKLELEAYEKKVNPVTGRTTYAAPTSGDDDEGAEEIHDDTVMALALAYHGILNRYQFGSLDDDIALAIQNYGGY